MKPIYLTLIGITLWLAITVWDFRAKEMTKALFWSRLIAPVVAAILFGAALYLKWVKL